MTRCTATTYATRGSEPAAARFDRRAFILGTAAAACTSAAHDARTPPFSLRYITASCMYGRMPLEDILPEVPRTGARAIDIWPERHGNQREQIEAMGHERFAALLKAHDVRLGILSRFDLDPFGLGDEVKVAAKLGGAIVVTASRGPPGLEGAALRDAVQQFVERMKPHAAAAQKAGITIAIENHASSLIASPDSLRHLAKFAPAGSLGIALAPYHLPQDAALIARLIEDLGGALAHFYAWQYGAGCHTKLPKEQELLQLPGRGPLDFTPILAALRRIDYRGWTEVFMHPVPRGIPILPDIAQVTAEINRAREYLAGPGKGVRPLFCEAPSGPFREKRPDPFSWPPTAAKGATP